jgi:uridine monophosphate synthetase
MEPSKKELLVEGLFEIGAIAFGEFTLKSGEKSPVYCDLRLLVSHPKLMKLTSEIMVDLIKINDLEYDIICGVPVGAIPIATILSMLTEKPMILKRKEVKNYGTKKTIEGCFKRNDRCLVIEDVTTSGSSIIETKDTLKDEQVVVNHSVVVLDRQQGAESSLHANGIKLWSILNLKETLEILMRNQRISADTYYLTKKFLSAKE